MPAVVVLALAAAYVLNGGSFIFGGSPAADPGAAPQAQTVATQPAPGGTQPAATSAPALNLTAPAATTAPALSLTAQKAADFDFYVLALSWSPDYCAGDGANDTQECSLGRKLGFSLHGLWPQYNKGYPSDCSSQKLPADVKQQFAGLFPNTSLFDHEWEKHGTCSGLDPASYLGFAKQVKESVSIPAELRAPQQPLRLTVRQLKDYFMAANPGLADASLAVMCSGSGRYLTELRICFSTAGQPQDCSREVLSASDKSCAGADFLVRNVK